MAKHFSNYFAYLPIKQLLNGFTRFFSDYNLGKVLSTNFK